MSNLARAADRAPGVYFDLIGDAWALIQAERNTWLAASAVSVLTVGSAILTEVYVEATTPLTAGLSTSLRVGTSALAIPLIAYALLIGMMHMAVKQAYGERIAVADVFVPLRQMWRTGAVALFSFALIYAGAAMCVVPGLCAIGTLCFAGLDTIERGTGAAQAIIESYKALRSKGAGMFGAIFVASVCSVLGSFAFGIGLILTLPIVAIVIGLHYTYFFPRESSKPDGPNAFATRTALS